MWPVLLNLTRDECRRTLRRLELEAYSNMISVFRAQGALEDNRKKLLEELRAVLHISNDRHSAEARRVSNDELLATIAEQLSGPNTGLGWICEGRRIIPLMPRGIPQTMYTEIADKAAEKAAAENKESQKKIEAEKLAAQTDKEMHNLERQSPEEDLHTNEVDEVFPPIATEDHCSKIWETELICRKRKIPEGSVTMDDSNPPVKNMRNIPVNTNQKHVNISQIYSRFSQPATSKSSGHSKHSYNQVSKVSTSKSHQPRQHKPRAHKQKNTQHMSKKQMKTQEISKSSSQPYNPPLPTEYTGPPGSFQADFAKTVLGNKGKSEYVDEMKSKILSPPNTVTDSPTMQLLTQPTTLPQELVASENSHSKETHTQVTPMSKQPLSGKHCHLIIKKRNETPVDKKVQMSEFKLLQKPTEGIKVLSNRQVVVAPSSTQKALNTTGKLVTTKVIGSVPRPRTNTPIIPSDKMIVVSKPSTDNRLASPKVVITSSNTITPSKETSVSSHITKTTETLTPKGIPATDLKVSAKTFVLNPKSGQKMVVLPAKTNKEGQMPLIHFKGIPTAMKLVSVSSQPVATKPPSITVTSKPTVVNTLSSNSKIVGVEPIKTANLADIVPVKGLTPVSSAKIPNPIVRTVNPKGNVIVVQKGSTLGKTITFSKNGNDMSKIIMGKNVNQLLQASKPDQVEPSKGGNVIVLELNNEQTGRTTTMSEILDSRGANIPSLTDQGTKSSELRITQDTPVLFESQISEDVCNTSSLDSAVSIEDINAIEESNLPLIRKEEANKSNFNKENIVIKNMPSVTDWEIELDTVSRKGKGAVDKLNSLHLDLGMSSDSENEYIGMPISVSTHSPRERIPRSIPSGVSSEKFSTSALSLATRTLLSQLQDDGSSSNDSSFALKSKSTDKFKETELKIDKSESEALSKAKAKLSEKVAEAKSQQKRIDVYSTTIASSDINLDPFSYLEEGMMAGDDEFTSETKRETRQGDVLDDQLSRLLGDDSANSTDAQTVSESLSLNKS